MHAASRAGLKVWYGHNDCCRGDSAGARRHTAGRTGGHDALITSALHDQHAVMILVRSVLN